MTESASSTWTKYFRKPRWVSVHINNNTANVSLQHQSNTAHLLALARRIVFASNLALTILPALYALFLQLISLPALIIGYTQTTFKLVQPKWPKCGFFAKILRATNRRRTICWVVFSITLDVRSVFTTSLLAYTHQLYFRSLLIFSDKNLESDIVGPSPELHHAHKLTESVRFLSHFDEAMPKMCQFCSPSIKETSRYALVTVLYYSAVWTL